MEAAGSVLAGVAALITALNARSIKKVNTEVKSPNGTPTGKMVADIKASLQEHVGDKNIHQECGKDSE